MRAPAGIELLSEDTWDCGSTGGEWSPGGCCGSGSGEPCSCGGSCGCKGEGGGSCGGGGKPSGEVPHLPDYDGEIWAVDHRPQNGRRAPWTFWSVGSTDGDEFLRPATGQSGELGTREHPRIERGDQVVGGLPDPGIFVTPVPWEPWTQVGPTCDTAMVIGDNPWENEIPHPLHNGCMGFAFQTEDVGGGPPAVGTGPINQAASNNVRCQVVSHSATHDGSFGAVTRCEKYGTIEYSYWWNIGPATKVKICMRCACVYRCWCPGAKKPIETTDCWDQDDMTEAMQEEWGDTKFAPNCAVKAQQVAKRIRC